MRTWIGGGCLALLTAGGLAFVMSGGGHISHVGPCVSGCCQLSTAKSSAACSAPDVTDVVPPSELAGAFPDDPLAEPRRLPFLNFDEPPLSGVAPAGLTVPANAADAPARIPLAE